MEEAKDCRVFISYSWTTPEHEKWVYDLAVRLMNDGGIDVKLDKWDLKPGQDKYAFMESMVQDQSVDKVLIICDKGYKDKADSRTGGVGAETQIITPKIYNKTKQEKFIPVVAEKGDEFDSYLPDYLKSRIAIDMSSDEVYEEGYEQLLRLIYNKPQFRKPAKGQPPAFLFEDEKMPFRTRTINKRLKHALINKPNQVDLIINEFIDEFLQLLDGFAITYDDMQKYGDEHIYNNINDMKPLTDDYIDFLSLLCQTDYGFNIDIIIDLFEKLYSYTEPSRSGTYSSFQFDHYKFFIMELFLYTVAVFISNDMYKDLDILLSTKYFIGNKDDTDGETFTKLRFYISSLDEARNRRLKLRKFSVTADLLVQRSKTRRGYQDKLLDADLLLYYISSINPNNSYAWFPMTYIYKDGKVDIIRKMIRKRHFERVKHLFNVKNPEEMIELIKDYENIYADGYIESFMRIPHIKDQVKVEDIGKY